HLIADQLGFVQDGFRQPSPQPEPTKFGPNIQSLHFADTRFEWTQRHASGGFVIDFGQQQASARRSVLPRQTRVFLVEALEAQAEAERLSVFDEQLTRGLDFGIGRDRQNRDLLFFRWLGWNRNCGGHPLLLTDLRLRRNCGLLCSRNRNRWLIWMALNAQTTHNFAHRKREGRTNHEEENAVRHGRNGY